MRLCAKRPTALPLAVTCKKHRDTNYDKTTWTRTWASDHPRLGHNMDTADAVSNYVKSARGHGESAAYLSSTTICPS